MMAMGDSIGSLAWVQPSASHRPDNKCLQTKLVSANSTTVCVQTQMSPTNAVVVNCTVWTRQDCSVHLEYSKRFTVECVLAEVCSVPREPGETSVHSVQCALCTVHCAVQRRRDCRLLLLLQAADSDFRLHFRRPVCTQVCTFKLSPTSTSFTSSPIQPIFTITTNYTMVWNRCILFSWESKQRKCLWLISSFQSVK